MMIKNNASTQMRVKNDSLTNEVQVRNVDYLVLLILISPARDDDHCRMTHLKKEQFFRNLSSLNKSIASFDNACLVTRTLTLLIQIKK